MLDPAAHLNEGIRYLKLGMLDEAISEFRLAASADDPPVVATALCREALAYRAGCRWDEAIDAARRSAEIARTSGSDELLAEALNAEAIVHQERGNFDAALELLGTILTMPIGPRVKGLALQNRGSIAAQRADLDAAAADFRQAFGYFQQAGYEWGMGFALNNQAAAALAAGRFKEAEVVAGQASRAAAKVGDLELFGIAILNRAEAFGGQQRFDEAEVMARKAMAHFEREENDLRRAQCYRVLADLRVMQGDRAEAHRLYGLGLGLARSVDVEVEAARIADSMRIAAPLD